jgi:hypothetical protein
MSRLLHSRLEKTIAAGKHLIQELCVSSDRTHLDALYAHMLPTCFSGNAQRAGKILGTISVLEEPTTPTLLGTLLDISHEELATHLQAFVDARLLTTETPMDLINDTTNLRMCHRSLRDFVTNPQRCKVKHYLIHSAKTHMDILYRCLCLLKTHLRQDICELRHPGLPNADIPDLSARMARFVPEALRYACISWPVHLIASGSVSGPVSAALLDFCKNHLLHWLEVLSLLGELTAAGKHRAEMMAWCEVSISLLS